jgi:hypothetical protein
VWGGGVENGAILDASEFVVEICSDSKLNALLRGGCDTTGSVSSPVSNLSQIE